MLKVERYLQVHFAILTALGGLLLASGEVGPELPLIAVVAAIASYILVDRYQVIALPTPLAYVGMGLVATYCMLSFFFWTGTENQLMAVAQLLVMVLVVLLFQRKNVRVFEQIGVFCLLELIVAAVFNSAMMFGLLLIPFSIVGLRALVLLQTLVTIHASDSSDDGLVRTSSPQAALLIARKPRRFPRYGIIVLAPSIILIAAFFFYGLPRVGGASESRRIGGSQTVGFAESLYLDQVGSLLQNPELVMRVSLTDLRTNEKYKVRKPIYLRGQTLETYDFSKGSGKWTVFVGSNGQATRFLPEPVYPEQRTSSILFDEVRVDIEQQPLTTDALFSIPPYHILRQQKDIDHLPGRWILRPRPDSGISLSNRVNYRFGTHSFSDGIQNRYIRYYGPGEYSYRNAPLFRRNERPDKFPTIDPGLIRAMTEFDASKMPTVAREANRLVAGLGTQADSPMRIAEEFEKFLSMDESFLYTTDLNEKRNRSVDPIEEFLSSYRAGHCQYYASTLVMMLRSQGIPARVVVGYRSDELNPIGGHYIVRQLHAHAWVECLVASEDVPIGAMLVGQAKSGPVLVRLDPTPGSNVGEAQERRSIRHFYDFAQTMWNSYVLDMNGERQSESLFGRDEDDGLTSAYVRLGQQLEALVVRINTSQLGAGALSGGKLFSWRGAALGIIGTLILFGLYQIGAPSWMRIQWFNRRKGRQSLSVSKVAFFQQLCISLAELGLLRRDGETPQEFIEATKAQLSAKLTGKRTGPETEIDQPLGYLLGLYYQVRFGGNADLTEAETADVAASLGKVDQLVEQAKAS